MSRAKPYPSDPAVRAAAAQVDDPTLARTIERFGDVDVDELTVEDRRRLGESQPVTPPTSAPSGAPSPNSVRAREEGLGVDPAITEANLEALAELHAAGQDSQGEGGTGDADTPPAPPKATKAKAVKASPSQKAKPPTIDPAEQAKRDARNARRREQRAAKKAPAKAKATKKAAK